MPPPHPPPHFFPADIQFEEKKVRKSITEAAKRGDMGTCRVLAKEIIQSRRAVSRLYVNKAQMISIGNALSETLGALPVCACLCVWGRGGGLLGCVPRAAWLPLPCAGGAAANACFVFLPPARRAIGRRAPLAHWNRSRSALLYLLPSPPLPPPF